VSASAAPVAAPAPAGSGTRARPLAIVRRLRRPELVPLALIALLLNVWALSRNGWANDYYSAAVRSMASSWHNFLFASLDPSGVMTVDKPPLALWVQALSVRVFGYHPLAILLPQALMGVAGVVLVYDLVQRRFGRLGGSIAGLALATTPITVAISRHNNPDALLVLCCVAALWCTVRAFEAAGRSREGDASRPAGTRSHAGTGWLVLAGVCVGLGFETKMGVALVVVPGIALAWLWCAPAARRGATALAARLHALRQLLWGGLAMVLVGGAWPLLVELTPASQRPWVSGTSNNTILSLILEYNGAGRVDGQTGGPGGGLGGGANNMFGGSTGPLRLLNAALGGQAGWLLGFALAGGVAILLTSRLRPREARSGWLIAVGGAFLTTAVLFSFASGIFHPYYVSLLAPFAAALVGAGAAELIPHRSLARVLGPLAIAAGVVVELVVRSRYPGQLPWLAPVLIAVGVAAAVALVLVRSPRARIAAVLAVTAALMLAPAVWAVDTLGYATSGTFPSGGPQSAETGGFGGPGGFGARGAFGGPAGAGGPGGFPGGAPAGQRQGEGPPGAAQAGGPQLFGSTGTATGAGTGAGAGTGQGAGPGAGTTSGSVAAGHEGFGGFPGASAARGGSGAGPGGAPFGNSISSAVTSYVRSHGGGTIAVSSQSSAAGSIIAGDADVAGIGGFSGRESDVSVSWLAQEVRLGKIRWVLVQDSSGPSFGPGDTRTGSRTAMAAAARACQRVTLSSESASAGGASSSAQGGSGSSLGGETSSSGLYDCQGRAAAIAATAASVSSERSI
jgi:4-amino-4-deoxy-L-arabinose transferase-like glycosyltransferase